MAMSKGLVSSGGTMNSDGGSEDEIHTAKLTGNQKLSRSVILDFSTPSWHWLMTRFTLSVRAQTVCCLFQTLLDTNESFDYHVLSGNYTIQLLAVIRGQI